ncbi:MAG TPA: WD40 repeat domain-containing protein [Ktedonobacteraceae bacterium]
MSILDKPLTPPPRKSRGRTFIILSFILILLIAHFIFTDVRADLAFIAHFVNAPDHYTYSGHTDYVSAVAWSPDGKRIASASGDHTVQVWDAANGGHVLTYRGHGGDVLSLAWSPDGKNVVSGSVDKTVQVWDATSGTRVYTYNGHSDAVFDVAWSPDGKRIASASNDGSVQIWDAFTGMHVLSHLSPLNVRLKRTPWNTVAWSPGGKLVAIGGAGDAIILDSTTGRMLGYYGHHGGSANSIAWSPDGVYLAIGRDDTTVQVWNAATTTNVYTYMGHSTDVFTVAWSPDGKRIASGSSDGLVQVWDALTGNHVYTYRGHTDYYPGHLTSGKSVNAVAWSPDGKRIASGGDDMTVQVWQAM